MGITDLDPIRWGLLFERFINPERVSLPDFDVDFCQTRRDETIQYVRQKYGDDIVVAIGTHGSWKSRSAFGHAARCLGISCGSPYAASQSPIRYASYKERVCDYEVLPGGGVT